jgi:hypothetical protein
MQLTCEFIPASAVTYLLINAWYTSGRLKYYQNSWDIEVNYRYHKNSLRFDEYQTLLLTSIKRFWGMVFMACTFLELFRVSTRKKLNLKTIGDTIAYFRTKYMVDVAKFAYTCAVNGVALEYVVVKFRVAA